MWDGILLKAICIVRMGRYVPNAILRARGVSRGSGHKDYLCCSPRMLCLSKGVALCSREAWLCEAALPTRADIWVISSKSNA